MIQDGLNLLDSVWRVLSGNLPVRDGDGKTIVNRQVLTIHMTVRFDHACMSGAQAWRSPGR
jgi:hypothetical protein